MNRPVERGFTLVEALVALALLAVVLLTSLALLAQEPRIDRRLRARQEAARAVEAVLEGIRAGAVPLRSGPLAPSLAPAPGASGGPLLILLDVAPAGPAGLYDVRVSVHYSVLGDEARWEARTLAWSP